MLTVNFKNPFFVFGIVIIVFFGYWVFFSGSKNNVISDTSDKNPNITENGLSSSSLSWLESASTSYENYESRSNLTDILSQNISSEFTSKIDFSKASSSPDSLLDQLNSLEDLSDEKIASFLQNNPLKFLKSVSDSEIKIINDNSDETIRKYSQNYSIIFSQAGGSVASDPEKLAEILSDTSQKENSEELTVLIFDLNQGFDKMKELGVPSNLVGFHKKNLMFLKNISIVLHSIRIGEADPLRAYLAIQDGVPMITSSITEIEKDFKELSSKYKF